MGSSYATTKRLVIRKKPRCRREARPIDRRARHPPQAPSVRPIDAISERRSDDVAVLIGQFRQLLVVAIEKGVLRTAETVQRNDQRKRPRAIVGRRYVHVVRHHFAGGAKKVMALEVAGALGEWILFRFDRSDDRLSGGTILARIKRPQLHPTTIDVPHPIDRKQNIRAHAVRRGLRLAFKTGDDVL